MIRQWVALHSLVLARHFVSLMSLMIVIFVLRTKTTRSLVWTWTSHLKLNLVSLSSFRKNCRVPWTEEWKWPLDSANKSPYPAPKQVREQQVHFMGITLLQATYAKLKWSIQSSLYSTCVLSLLLFHGHEPEFLPVRRESAVGQSGKFISM